MRMKFSEVLKRRPAGRGGASDERRSDYSRIPGRSDSYPLESPETAGEAQAAVPGSSAQPGPSGQSGSRELDGAESLRLRAREQGERGTKLLEQAQEAKEAGNFTLWKKLKKLAKKCFKAMVKFHKIAADIIFEVKNKFTKRGEIDLHLLLVDEAIERAEQSIEAATAKGDRRIRFITGKGKHSPEGPKILPALREYIRERGLESEMDPKNEGVLVVHLPQNS